MAPGTLAYERYLDHLAAEAARFDAAITAAPAGVSVPACPAWDRDALRDHQAGVLAFWTRQLADDATTGEPVTDGVEVEASRPVTDLASTMVDRLAAIGVDQPCWNWSGVDQVAGWVARRMAQELSVHRVDAESIAGAAAPIADDIAHDGIDELLDVFVDAAPGTETGAGIVVELLDPTRRAILTTEGAVRSTDDPVAYLHGSASDVVLSLWSRASPATWTGDERAPEAWRHLAEFE